MTQVQVKRSFFERLFSLSWFTAYKWVDIPDPVKPLVRISRTQKYGVPSPAPLLHPPRCLNLAVVVISGVVVHQVVGKLRPLPRAPRMTPAAMTVARHAAVIPIPAAATNYKV